MTGCSKSPHVRKLNFGESILGLEKDQKVFEQKGDRLALTVDVPCTDRQDYVRKWVEMYSVPEDEATVGKGYHYMDWSKPSRLVVGINNMALEKSHRDMDSTCCVNSQNAQSTRSFNANVRDSVIQTRGLSHTNTRENMIIENRACASHRQTNAKENIPIYRTDSVFLNTVFKDITERKRRVSRELSESPCERQTKRQSIDRSPVLRDSYCYKRKRRKNDRCQNGETLDRAICNVDRDAMIKTRFSWIQIPDQERGLSLDRKLKSEQCETIEAEYQINEDMSSPKSCHSAELFSDVQSNDHLQIETASSKNQAELKDSVNINIDNDTSLNGMTEEIQDVASPAGNSRTNSILENTSEDSDQTFFAGAEPCKCPQSDNNFIQESDESENHERLNLNEENCIKIIESQNVVEDSTEICSGDAKQSERFSLKQSDLAERVKVSHSLEYSHDTFFDKTRHRSHMNHDDSVRRILSQNFIEVPDETLFDETGDSFLCPKGDSTRNANQYPPREVQKNSTSMISHKTFNTISHVITTQENSSSSTSATEISISTENSPPRQNSNPAVEFSLLDSAKKKRKPKRGTLTEKLQSLINSQVSSLRIWRHQLKRSKGQDQPARSMVVYINECWTEFTRQFLRGTVVEDSFNLLPSLNSATNNSGRVIIIMTIPEITGRIEMRSGSFLRIAMPWEVLDDKNLTIRAIYLDLIPLMPCASPKIFEQREKVMNRTTEEYRCDCIGIGRRLFNCDRSERRPNVMQELFSL